jgi:hypothetical protein
MKYLHVLPIVILLFLINSAAAQQPRLAIHSYASRPDSLRKGKYKMDQFIGRWQETARIKNKTKEKVEFTDTLYIRFYNDNKAETKEGNSLVITGSSELFNDDYITTSASDFKVLSVTPNQVILDDMVGYLHSMSRTTHFAYEDLSSPPISDSVIKKNTIDLSGPSLLRNWFAYRRGANPGFVTSETPLIRKLKILEKLSEGSFRGEIEFARFGQAVTQPCTLVFTGTSLSIITEGHTWNVEVYKADGQEMVLGKKGELVYYLKSMN